MLKLKCTVLGRTNDLEEVNSVSVVKGFNIISQARGCFDEYLQVFENINSTSLAM